MIKKTMTFKDFTGEEVTEDFYFNLTKAELIELEVSAEGNSLSAWLEKIAKNMQGAELIKAFKLIIAQSYGQKSVDGRRFEKSEKILAEFTSTVAYSDLFELLATDATFAAEFVNGLMPERVAEAAQASLSPSEAARKASEERMQGHRKTQPAPAPRIEQQPDLPVELGTAPPVLAPEPVVSEAPISVQQDVQESREQFEARIRQEYEAKIQAQNA